MQMVVIEQRSGTVQQGFVHSSLPHRHYRSRELGLEWHLPGSLDPLRLRPVSDATFLTNRLGLCSATDTIF
jgi:hypothetical protein